LGFGFWATQNSKRKIFDNDLALAFGGAKSGFILPQIARIFTN
jgi:hypothetical protein